MNFKTSLFLFLALIAVTITPSCQFLHKNTSLFNMRMFRCHLLIDVQNYIFLDWKLLNSISLFLLLKIKLCTNVHTIS